MTPLPGAAVAAPGVFDTVLEVGAAPADVTRPGPNGAEFVAVAAG